MSASVLVVDNYDSFVFNLVQYLQQLGASTTVVRNDGVLISPGPGAPVDAGVSIPMIHKIGGKVPIFGVCLGHQAIAEAFGATVSRAPELLHGKTSEVVHDGTGVLRGLPSPFTATRYHSLAVEEDTIPSELLITARTDSGVVMGLRHRELLIEGVQFHPESVLTEHGYQMLANWLADCGDKDAQARSVGLAPVVSHGG
jgi:para-aminobenzoate synthetase component 2